jgi:hypothetical protein
VRAAFEAAAKEYHAADGSLFQMNHDQANGQMFISVSGNIPCGAAWARWIQNSSITLCPAVNSDGNPNFSTAVVFHEVGHQAGLGEVGGCVGSTVMAPASPTATDHANSLTNDDRCTIFNEFVEPAASCQPPPTGCPVDYYWDPHFCDCLLSISPVLLTLGPNAFRLTSIDGGVRFDLDGDGTVDRVSWTAADSDDAFLWMDRNGNGVVDDGRELFGTFTPLSWTMFGPAAAHGLDALAWFDLTANGGVSDGWIDSRDRVFNMLRLWRDSNHDGLSQAGEILTLAQAGVTRISLEISESRRRDRYGHLFKYKAQVQSLNDQHAVVRRLAYDVYLRIRQWP